MARPRRDLKTLRTQLASLSEGQWVTAEFLTDRYGEFSVTGRMVLLSGNVYAVGGIALFTGKLTEDGKPDLTAEPDPVRDLFTIEPLDDEPEFTTAHDSCQHGDTVTAVLDQMPYGTFSVTGQALGLEHRDTVLVGSWHLTEDSQNAPRVRNMEVHENAAELFVPRLAPMRNDDLESEATL